jgi:hypothetical protein
MFLDSNDFESVWQHICACANQDREGEKLIESFDGRGGNWVTDVQDNEIRVESRVPRGRGFRWLSKSQFRSEWKKLVRTGESIEVRDQVIWDMFCRYFEDSKRNPHDRSRLFWTGFRSKQQ